MAVCSRNKPTTNERQRVVVGSNGVVIGGYLYYVSISNEKNMSNLQIFQQARVVLLQGGVLWGLLKSKEALDRSLLVLLPSVLCSSW